MKKVIIKKVKVNSVELTFTFFGNNVNQNYKNFFSLPYDFNFFTTNYVNETIFKIDI